MSLAAVTMDYHAMRLAWCRRALLELLRRWGVYAVVAAVVLGAGISGAGTVLAGAAAWAVVPLFDAVATSAARGLAATGVQAAAGALVVWALRPLLLPARWVEAERALPLPPAALRRSDLALAALALVPWFVLEAAGAASLLAGRPPWLRGREAAALAALVAAGAGSLSIGVRILARRRAPPRGARRADAGRAPRSVGTMSWRAALLALPLWRGPARRAGALMAAGGAALLVPAIGLAAAPAYGGWWPAALALAGLLLATRLSTLVREEIGPLLEAAAALPIDSRAARRQAAALVPLPLLPGLAALLAVAASPALRARPAVLAAYAVGLVGAAAWPSFVPPADAGTAAGRWLLSLVLLFALASEVFA